MSIEIIVSILAALGIGGLLGAFLNRHFEKQKQTNEHDAKIFHQGNEILSEQKLRDIAEYHVLSDHSIMNNDFYLLREWCLFFSHVGNQYLNVKIKRENQKMVDDLGQLVDFVAKNFFTIRGQNPGNHSQYLRPDWSPSRGDDPSEEKISKYHEYANKLELLTEKAVKQFSKYRLVIKQNLRI